MYLTLRLLIVVCYFLPFAFFQVTCNGPHIKLAYNQQEYLKNEKAADSASASATVEEPDSTGNNTLQSLPVADSATTVLNSDGSSSNVDLEQLEKWDWGEFNLLVPVDGTLSAFGTMFVFKNVTGKRLMQVAFILSLLVLPFARFFKKKDVLKYLVTANLLFVVGFIINAFISEVSLLWAAWLLAALSIVQTVMAFRKEKATT